MFANRNVLNFQTSCTFCMLSILSGAPICHEINGKMISLQGHCFSVIEQNLLLQLQASVKFAVYESVAEFPSIGLTSAMSILKDSGNCCNIPINTLRLDHDLASKCAVIARLVSNTYKFLKQICCEDVEAALTKLSPMVSAMTLRRESKLD